MTHTKPVPPQVLLKLIQPYTRVRIPFISQRLNVPEKDVESLLVTLILDGRVAGYIDQVCASCGCGCDCAPVSVVGFWMCVA